MNIPRNPILYPKVLLALLFTIIGATPAAAHSFNLMMVLPASGIDKPLQDDLMQAFLLASQERDSHADETSDGHLGGLDVFITFTTNPNQIKTADPNIIATPLPGVDLIEISGAAVMRAPKMTSDGVTRVLRAASDPSLTPFAQRFQATTGRMPGPEAKAVYVTARIIGRAVREAGGVADQTLNLRLLSP
ncbi:hypothetical protein MNBD_ALPHA07-362 [hydrothermal vent metagenome]|uniref:Uncharacterized protein n=1 Tax=hydrothermal vent metagenome TaxID=652676 RepID=A0A3B0R6P7_9ZZZZ